MLGRRGRCLRFGCILLLASGLALAAGCGEAAAPDAACTSDAECIAALAGAAPCRSAACVAGQCASTPLSGVPCDPGDACVLDARCEAGECRGTPRVCDDGVACTHDRCEPAVGGCVFVPDPTTCDDANPCTADLCTPSGCEHTPVLEACDDGDPCTVADRCEAGRCVGLGLPCDDSDPCTADRCEPESGRCVHEPSPVDDAGQPRPCVGAGDPCATGVCGADGRCVVSPTPCDDGNPCTVARCEERRCVYEPAAAGAACVAADPCLSGGQCIAGQCVALPRDCSDADPCTADRCEAGRCIHEPWSGEPAVPAGDACNRAQCVAGRLTLLAVSCDDADPCTADGCDPLLGCTHQRLAGTPCDDGLACTVADLCDAATGRCTGRPRDCDDGEDCTTDRCEPASGDCVFTARLDGAACFDGDPCSLGDTCIAGRCAPGPALSCNDGNPCTVDRCQPVSASCSHEALPDGTPCVDGSACTLRAECRAEVCVAVEARVCVAPDPCTAAQCNPADGTCVSEPFGEGSPCDDGEPCTRGEHCTAGACGGGSAVPGCCVHDGDCDTGDPCSLVRCLHNRCDAAPRRCAAADACSPGVCQPASGSCESVPLDGPRVLWALTAEAWPAAGVRAEPAALVEATATPQPPAFSHGGAWSWRLAPAGADGTLWLPPVALPAGVMTLRVLVRNDAPCGAVSDLTLFDGVTPLLALCEAEPTQQFRFFEVPLDADVARDLHVSLQVPGDQMADVWVERFEIVHFGLRDCPLAQNDWTLPLAADPLAIAVAEEPEARAFAYVAAAAEPGAPPDVYFAELTAAGALAAPATRVGALPAEAYSAVLTLAADLPDRVAVGVHPRGSDLVRLFLFDRRMPAGATVVDLAEGPLASMPFTNQGILPWTGPQGEPGWLVARALRPDAADPLLAVSAYDEAGNELTAPWLCNVDDGVAAPFLTRTADHEPLVVMPAVNQTSLQARLVAVRPFSADPGWPLTTLDDEPGHYHLTWWVRTAAGRGFVGYGDVRDEDSGGLAVQRLDAGGRPAGAPTVLAAGAESSFAFSPAVASALDGGVLVAVVTVRSSSNEQHTLDLVRLTAGGAEVDRWSPLSPDELSPPTLVAGLALLPLGHGFHAFLWGAAPAPGIAMRKLGEGCPAGPLRCGAAGAEICVGTGYRPALGRCQGSACEPWSGCE